MINIPLGFIQIILLVLHYGNIILMPWWLVWLPSLVFVTVAGIWLVCVLLIIVLTWFVEAPKGFFG